MELLQVSIQCGLWDFPEHVEHYYGIILFQIYVLGLVMSLCSFFDIT